MPDSVRSRHKIVILCHNRCADRIVRILDSVEKPKYVFNRRQTTRACGHACPLYEGIAQFPYLSMVGCIDKTFDGRFPR